MEEFVPTSPYVSARLEYAKKRLAEMNALITKLKTATNPDENGQGAHPAKITYSEAQILSGGLQTVQELAYGLDYAMKALNIYADPSFWKEVPEHTYAANDLGLKAKVALAQIDPV